MPSILFLSSLLAMTAFEPRLPRRQPIEPGPDPDPDPDNLYDTIARESHHITATSYAQRSYDPPPTLPPVPPDPLRRACRVCGAAAGVACDPERLGKAGKRGATAHRSR